MMAQSEMTNYYLAIGGSMYFKPRKPRIRTHVNIKTFEDGSDSTASSRAGNEKTRPHALKIG